MSKTKNFLGLLAALLLITLLGVSPALAQSPIKINQVELEPSSQPGDTNTCNVTVCLNGSCDYTNIQPAVNAVAQGCVVKVAAGTYTHANHIDPHSSVIHVNKSITIRGGYTPDFVEPPDPEANPTIVDAQGHSRALYITGDVRSDTDAGDIQPTIEGLHLTGGSVAGSGGGVLIVNTQATLLNNTIYDNSANNGAGIYLSKVHGAILKGNMISNNSATCQSGGIELDTCSDVTLHGNTISSNTAGDVGGGLLLNNSNATVTHNTISSNTADTGAGMHLLYSDDALVSHNTIINNHADYGGGIYIDSSAATFSYNTIRNNWFVGVSVHNSAPTFDNNVISDNTYGSLYDIPGIYLHNSPAMLRDNTISGHQGSGVYLEQSNPTIHNNHIFENITDYGGAIYAHNSNPTITNNTLNNNQGEGGAVYLENSPATISGNTISGNLADHGGGIHLKNSDSTLNANIIMSNTTFYAGGGVYVEESAITFNDNHILENAAWGDNMPYGGGGVYLKDSTATLNGDNISGNVAGGAFGGGVHIYNSSVTLENCTLDHNIAAINGGGLHAEYGDNHMTLIGNHITANSVIEAHGGGIYLFGTRATLTNNLISENQAIWMGGGLMAISTEITLSGNTISNNQALHGGGGFVSNSSVSLNGNLVLSNTALYGGGWLIYESEDVTFVNEIIANNQAEEQGAGLLVGSSTVDLLHTTIANNGGAGDGLYVGVFGSGMPSHANLTNTMLSGHQVGITVDAGHTANLQATLWDNQTDWAGGGSIAHTQDHWGDPSFVDPAGGDYHLSINSAALDIGVDAGIYVDIDGDGRPAGTGFDLGADELVLLSSKQR